MSFTPNLVAQLKEHKNIIGMKEENLSFEAAYKVSRQADETFFVFSAGGSCRRFLLTHAAGAQNFLGGIGNIYPKIEESFYKAIKDGDYEKAHQIVRSYEDPLFAVFGPIGWHRALQIALQDKQLLPTHNRLPFAKPLPEHIDNVREVLKQIETKAAGDIL